MGDNEPDYGAQTVSVKYKGDGRVPFEIARLASVHGAAGISLRGKPAEEAGVFYAEMRWNLDWRAPKVGDAPKEFAKECEAIDSVVEVLIGELESIRG